MIFLPQQPIVGQVIRAQAKTIARPTRQAHEALRVDEKKYIEAWAKSQKNTPSPQYIFD